MVTLDKLAVLVRVLEREVKHIDNVIADAQERRFVRRLKQGQLVHQAFNQIEQSVQSPAGTSRGAGPGWISVKTKWCKRAGIVYTQASMYRQIYRSGNPRGEYERQRKSSRLTTSKAEAKKRGGPSTPCGGVFAGAFAIMIQALDQQTPQAFMAYPSVKEDDVFALRDFLIEALPEYALD